MPYIITVLLILVTSSFADTIAELNQLIDKRIKANHMLTKELVKDAAEFQNKEIVIPLERRTVGQSLLN